MEHPAVAGFFRLQHGPVSLAGHGLLQGHSGSYPGSGGEVVDDQGPAPGPVNDEDGPVLQVGLPSHLHLGPQVGDQHAGDFHAASFAGVSGGTCGQDRPRSVSDNAPGDLAGPCEIPPLPQTHQIV